MISSVAKTLTELQRQERMLQDQLRLIEQMIETIPNPVFFEDENGRYLGCNQAFEQFVGKKREELVGKTAYELYPRELADTYHAADEELLAGRAVTQEYETSSLLADGTQRNVVARTATIFKSDGSIGGIIGVLWDVTEKKRAEQAFQEQLGLIEQMIQAIPNPAFYKDENGRYLGCNQAFEQFVGKKREELVGKTAYELYPRELADTYHAADEELFAKHTSAQEYETWSVSADGTRRDVMARKTTIFKSDGSVGGIIGVLWDITQKKQIERAFQEQLRLIQQLIETIPSPVFYKDENGQYLGCNRVFEQFVGKRREELVGKTVYELYPRELADTYHAADEELLAKRAVTQEYETLSIATDGTQRNVVARTATILKNDGSIGGIIGVLWDVTDKKRTEQAFQDQLRLSGVLWDITEKDRAEQAFQDQLRLIEQMIETIPSPVFYKDENGRYLGCNRAFEQFTGMKRKDVIGKTVYELYPKDLAETYQAADEELFKTPSGTQEYETSSIFADGTRRDVVARSAAFFKSDGSIGGIIGVLWDVTEKKRAEQMLREQALHDPLTGVFNRRYLAEVLEREFARASRGHTQVGVVMADADHFKRINDSFGHDCGDEVLRVLSRALVTHIRKGDIVCRYGGEEFTIVLPGASLEQTRQRAEEIRQAIRKLTIDYKGIRAITMSFGVAVFPDDGDTPEAVLKAADKALLEAKEAGRDRVVTTAHSAQTWVTSHPQTD